MRRQEAEPNAENATLEDLRVAMEAAPNRRSYIRLAVIRSLLMGLERRGMTVREIQGFLLDQYKVVVSADFISTVTDSVLEAVVEWQNRPLERSYPVVYFDALRVKIRDEGSVRNKAVYLALGIATKLRILPPSRLRCEPPSPRRGRDRPLSSARARSDSPARRHPGHA